jgi:hypothetical protein
MVPYCERPTPFAICSLDLVCLILGNGLANGQTRPILKSRRVDSAGFPNGIALAECGDDSAGRDVRSLALSSRLLVVSPSSTNDSMIPLDCRRACSILEHQTDDRKFIKHYDYHSEVVLRYEENPRILI